MLRESAHHPVHAMCAGEVRVVYGVADGRVEDHRKRGILIVSDTFPSTILIHNLISSRTTKYIKMQLSLPLSLALIASASAFAPAQKAFVSSKSLSFDPFADLSDLS
jgi:hypothetical protein